MSFLENLFKPKQTFGGIALDANIKLVLALIFDNKETTSKKNIFEALLFTSVHTLKVMEQKYPHLHKQFKADYLDILAKTAKKWSLIDVINQNPVGYNSLNDIINNRFTIYEIELKKIFSDIENYSIIDLCNYFFSWQNALSLNMRDSLTAILVNEEKRKELKHNIVEMLLIIEETVDIISITMDQTNK